MWRRARRLLLLPPFALLLAEWNQPLRGEHTFRQAHVAANIEKYVAHGLSLRPATYNLDVPGSLYDFPLYQLTVAALARAGGWPVLPLARLANVLLLAFFLVLAERLLARCGLPPLARELALVFAAWSPLTLFFWAVPFVDPLALVLALASCLGYLHYAAGERAGAGGLAPLALWFLGALGAALIKNPLYLPFFVALLWLRWRQGGVRALRRPVCLAFVVVLGLAVVGFKLYSNHVNGWTGFLEPHEAADYFGGWAERTRLKHWRTLGAALHDKLLPRPAGVLALAGLAAWLARRPVPARRALAVGLALGVLVTLAVFFGRHHEHDYYQLPFVLPAALFAGYGAQHLWLAGALAARRRRRRWPRLAAGWVLAGLCLWSVHAAQVVWRTMLATPGPSELLERGLWLQEHTRRDDFVAVVVGQDASNWDPSHLYYAQRDGCNLARSELTPRILAGFQRRAAGYRRFLVFVPWPSLAEGDPQLRALGGQELAAGGPGTLFRLEAAWLVHDGGAS